MAVINSIGNDQIAVGATPVGLALFSSNLKVMAADIVVQLNPILFVTTAGVDPAVDGTLAAVGSAIALRGFGQVKHFRAVQSAAAARLDVTYGLDWV